MKQASLPQGADAFVPSIESRLDPELTCFARHRAGRLDDVPAARSDVAEKLRLAKARLIPCRDIRIDDVAIPRTEGNGSFAARIYRPSAASGAPVLLYFHGGAFVLGSPELEDPGCVRYARNVGCVVISIDYRLAPEHPFPAGLDDCCAALTWAVRCAAEFGADAERIAVGGASAGGALAAAVALMARDRSGPELALQLLVYPVIDDRMDTPSMRRSKDGPVFAQPTAVDMWRLYLGGSVGEPTCYAAPARATDLSGLPPAYIEACALDPLLDEDVLYATRLRDAGVPTELHIVAGAPHGFDQFYLGAPGAFSWPLPVDHQSEISGNTEGVDPDFAYLPGVTQRMFKKRIAALRNAFHLVEHTMESNGQVSIANV